MKKLITLFLIVFLFSPSFSEIHKEWENRYDQSINGYQEFRDFNIDNYGNIIIAAYNNNVLSIKYSNSGQLLWTYEYHNSVSGSRAMTVDKLGNIYIAGDGNYGSKYLTIKLNSDGAKQWVSEYVNNNWAIPQDISLDSTGNIYVTGYMTINDTTLITTLKYNNEGILIWDRFFRGRLGSYTQPKNLFTDPYGNVYITGTDNHGINKFDFLLIKYDSAGNLLDSLYAGVNTNNDEAFSSCTDEFYNIYITGRSDSNYFTAKWDSSGQLLWTKTYSGFGYSNYARSICTDVDNNIYVTGASEDTLDSDYNIVTLKYNSSGDKLWEKSFSSPGDADDMPNSVTTDRNCNVYVTGYITNSMGNRDYVTFRYDSAGTLMWQFIENGAAGGFDESLLIKTDINSNVFVSGFSMGKHTTGDVVTVKYSEFSGLESISGNFPEKFILYQNYPNPFNPTTKIKFDISPSPLERAGVRLIIYDLLGREVTTLVNEALKSGTYEVEFDGSSYASGVYFYTLITDDFIKTNKMVLLK